jgi:hypothetical protein
MLMLFEKPYAFSSVALNPWFPVMQVFYCADIYFVKLCGNFFIQFEELVSL